MSTLEVSNLNDGTTTVATTFVTNGSAKSWLSLNGTGTIATRDSLNVSSVTDTGTGSYTVNINNDMANANYCATTTHDSSAYSADRDGVTTTTMAVGSYRRDIVLSGTGNQDNTLVCSAIYGDLA